MSRSKNDTTRREIKAGTKKKKSANVRQLDREFSIEAETRSVLNHAKQFTR